MSTAPLRNLPPESGPYLVPRKPVPSTGPSPLVLWHLLSLDAPTVAAVWTVFIGWCAGVRLSWVDPVAMFVAVWILYAADRLLDAKPLFTSPLPTTLEERHHFHHRHRARFLRCMLAASLPLTFLLHWTNEGALHLYVLLACLLSAWLLLVHARPAPSATSHRLPKELAVGVFFPAAVFIPTVARAPALRAPLLPIALAFATICTLNCLFLYAWEHPRKRGFAHLSTRIAVRHLKAIALVCTLAIDLLFLIVETMHRPDGSCWLGSLAHAPAALGACTLSGVALLLLHVFRNRIHPTCLRALADLVLLTPIPVAVAMRVFHG